MIEVEKFKGVHGYYIFDIKTSDGTFEISFQNNGDLYWRYICPKSILDSPDTKEIIITKENYFIYELFYKLYESIKTGKVYYNIEERSNYIQVKKDRNNLFKDGVIDWYSDDFDKESASRLIIKKEDEIFKVIFVKSKMVDGMFQTYSIRFRNSGSRYEPFNNAFMNMYKQLKNYDNNYHQIHIEEYLYNQKVLKKSKNLL